MPCVSVVIPAFRARETLPAALASVAACGLPPAQVEVVLAPDDGDSYAGLPDFGLTLTRCDSHHVATGAGPARNRALARARGEMVAFLDADDTWAPGYLATLLPLARRAGAAFGQTAILSGDAPLLCLPGARRRRLGLADFGQTGASFHPVVQRGLAGPFVNQPAQDVLHAMEVLSCMGGRAPLGKAVYELRLAAHSATAQADFAARAALAYESHIRAIEEGRTRLRAADIPAGLAAFRAKARLNAAFMADGAGQPFYAFVNARAAPRPQPD